MAGSVVAPWLPASAVVACVGQSVGRVEAERGRPFTGPAGRQLRAWLRTSGLDPDRDVAYTNVVMEFHPEAPNYLPAPGEVKVALPRIGSELALLPQLRAIVLVGAVAAHLALPGPIGALVGRRTELLGLPAWPCWHPSYWLRSKSYRRRAEVEGEVLAVLAEAVAVARGGVAAELVLPQPHIVEEVTIT